MEEAAFKRPLALHWSEIKRWTSTAGLLRFSKRPAGWRFLSVGELANQIQDKEKVIPDKEYPMAGVKWYGEGLFHREIVLGKDQSANYLYPLKPGAIIYNRLFAWKESFAVVPDDYEGLYVSNEFPQFEIDKDIALAEYIYLLLTTKKITNAVNSASIGSAAISRNRFKESDFLAFNVPIPPLSVQRKIIRYWKDSIENLAAAQSSIDGNETHLSNDILRSSSIEISMGKPLTKIFTTTFGSIERWGVEFNRHPWTLQNLIKSGKYQSAPLEEYADINPGIDLKLNDVDMVSFIPMEAVDDKDGRIAKNDSKTLREVRTGYTRFQEGDVIWAKITPCMQNGKSAIARNLTNGIGFGSTEFHVIRSRDTGLLTNEFIHLLLRIREIRIAATRYFVGSAGQQRVPKEFLEELHIPIPPLNIQTELVTRVTEARFEIGKIREGMYLQRKNALTEVEQMILGVRPVEEI
jgi:type I restriction enzyme S subunit